MPFLPPSTRRTRLARPALIARRLVAAFLATGGSVALAATYTITSASGFSSLPSTLQAGDEVIVKNGVYASVARTLTAAGTASNPVVLRAENPGQVFFSGLTQFVIKGSWLKISGLVFDGDVAAGAPKSASGIFRFQIDSSDCSITDCRLDAFDAGGGAAGAAAEYILVNGYRHTIEYCSFTRKSVPNPVITLVPQEDDDAAAGAFPTRDTPRRHRIRYCYFGERTAIADNGYETIRVGDSGYQMYDMSVVVEHCLFERAIYGADVSNHEPEVVSSKSRNNQYRFNTFLHCKGGLVLRHGDDCRVEGNFFFGEPGSAMGAGVRVIGLRHLVRNNYFQDVGGSGLRAAFCLMKGSGPFPENSTNNGYESPDDARVFHNTFVNCAAPIELGSTTASSGTTAPVRVLISNNLIQSSFSVSSVLVFNGSNGWTIDKVAFAANFAWHPGGAYGSVLPASGLSTGADLRLALDSVLGCFVPASNSPVIDTAVPTSPATTADLRGLVRSGLADAGAVELSAAGQILNRPLARADVGPAFDGRSSAARAPAILSNPENKTVYEGDPASLTAVFATPFPDSLQWYRNEIPISGATGATLAIQAASLADAGAYTVTVSNSRGSAASSPATLRVSAGILLLNDNFDDASASNQSLPGSAAWLSSSGTHTLSQGALSIAKGRHALAYFTGTGSRMIETGRGLTLTLTLRFSTVGSAASGLRLGLFNSNGATRATNGQNNVFNLYDGYIVTTTATGGAPAVFRRRLPGEYASALLTSLSNTTPEPDVPIYAAIGSDSAATPGFVAGQDYRMTLAVARLAADRVRLSYSITGGSFSGSVFTLENTDAPVVAFDCLARASISTNGSDFAIDDISVDYAPLPALTPLQAWRQARFATPLSEGDAADAADPDRDGVFNLLEYALGLDPRSADGADTGFSSTVLSIGNDQFLALSFTRALAAADVAIVVQSSTDLVAWTDIDPYGANQVSASSADGLQTLLVRDSAPLSPGARRFLRLRVSLP